jgi:hypothetical protein
VENIDAKEGRKEGERVGDRHCTYMGETIKRGRDKCTLVGLI